MSKIVFSFQSVIATIAVLVLNAGAALALDLRVVVIDTGQFAEISPSASREAAVRAMAKQLGEIEAAGPRARETVLLYGQGSSIEIFPDLSRDTALSGQAVFQKLLEQLEDGKGYDKAGFELVDLQKTVLDLLYSSNLIQRTGFISSKLFGKNNTATPKSVSVHVFAQQWVTEENDTAKGRVVETDIPTYCMQQDQKNTTIIPGYIEIEFDFRPPLGGHAPKPAGMAALIAVVTGSADRRSNVLTRGATMPVCPTNDASVFEPWAPLGSGNGQLDCRPEAVDRDRVVACPGDDVPQYAGIAPNLDQTPIYLVSNPSTDALRSVGLSTAQGGAGVGLLAHIGPLALRPGVPPAPHGLAPSRYAAWLDVAPGAGCAPGTGFDIQIGGLSGANDALGISVSRHYCRKLSLSISELDLQ